MRSLKSLIPIGVAIALSWPMWNSLQDAFSRAHWYPLTGDEALHAEVITVLAETGRYSSWVHSPFVGHLTTGPTVIVPAALLSFLLPISPSSAGRVMLLIYHLAFLGLLGFWMVELLFHEFSRKRKALRVLFALSLLGIFHMAWRGLQGSGYFLFGILGEGAGVFYLTSTLYLLWKNNFQTTPSRFLRWAGVCASLAVLSKPYFGLLIPCLFVGPFFVLPNRKHFTHSALFLLQGIALPFFLYWLWMVFVLGFGGSLTHLLSIPGTMRDANGAGLPQTLSLNSLFSACLEHIQSLPQILKVRSLLLALAGVIFLAVSTSRRIRFTSLTAFSFLFVILHLGWWFFLSPGAQARYLLPPLLVLWVFCLFGVVHVIRRVPQNLFPVVDPRQASLAFSIALLFFGFQVVNSWVQTASQWSHCAFCRQRAIQTKWKQLHASAPLQELRARTTAQGHVPGLDLALSAPHALVKSPAPYVLVGPWHDKLGFLEGTQGCKKIFGFPKMNEGIFQCDSK